MLGDLVLCSALGASAGYLVNRQAPDNTLGLVLYALIGVIGALVGALTTSFALPAHISLTRFDVISALVALTASSLFLGIARVATMRYDAHQPSLR